MPKFQFAGRWRGISRGQIDPTHDLNHGAVIEKVKMLSAARKPMFHIVRPSNMDLGNGYMILNTFY